MMTQNDSQRFQILLMKAVDKALSPEEENEFNMFIRSHAKCKAEWDEYVKLSKITGGIKMKLPDQEKWDLYWDNIYNRLERKLGWVLFSVGLIILFATGGFYAIQGFLMNPDIPVTEKIGLSALFLGCAVLLASVLREKITLRKTDKYKDLVR